MVSGWCVLSGGLWVVCCGGGGGGGCGGGGGGAEMMVVIGGNSGVEKKKERRRKMRERNSDAEFNVLSSMTSRAGGKSVTGEFKNCLKKKKKKKKVKGICEVITEVFFLSKITLIHTPWRFPLTKAQPSSLTELSAFSSSDVG